MPPNRFSRRSGHKGSSTRFLPSSYTLSEKRLGEEDGFVEQRGGRVVSGVSGRRDEGQEVGLCDSCQHARQVRSDRGSVFYFCKRSDTDPNFPKYPALPLLECPGYETEPGGGDRLNESQTEPQKIQAARKKPA